LYIDKKFGDVVLVRISVNSLVLVFIGWCNPLFSQHAEDGEPVHYKISRFATSDGLPGNTLLNLQTDSQGYLWLGGFEGITRFDGTHFVTFNPAVNPEFKSSQINAIEVDKNGNLWIGTGKGLVRHTKGEFINLATADFSFNIESIAVDDLQHVIWLGTRNGGLYQYDIQKKNYERIESRFSQDIITSVELDSAGGIWISSDRNGFAHYDHKTWQYYSTSDGLRTDEITGLHWQDGKLYVYSTQGLHVLKNGKIEVIPSFNNSRVTKVKSDPNGNMWVLTTSGVHVLRQGRGWQTLTKRDGLSVDDIRDIVFDQGSIWLATYRGGLNHLLEEKFISFSAREGLITEAVSSIYQVSTNKFMVGTTDGHIFSIENGMVKPFLIRNFINKPVGKILKDHAGNLWFATYDGLLLVTADGREKLFTEKDGLPTRQLRAIIQDRNKNYWIGSRTDGVIKMEFNHFSIKPIFTKAYSEALRGANATFIMSMSVDGDDNLILATNIGAIIKILPNGLIKQHFTHPDGLGEAAFSAHADEQGTIWAASSNGVSRIKDDSVVTLSRREGMPQETIYDVVEDDLGYLWMPTAKGIMRVLKQELEDYMDDKKTTVHWRLYDNSDDLAKSECTGASQILKDASGRMWFPMLEGLIQVDPKKITLDSEPPEIRIDGLSVDDQNVDITKEVVLQAGTKRLVFSYGAISLKHRKAIHYKYQIEGFDGDWIKAGSNTAAVYTSLPAGRHTFKVTACNRDGVCTIDGARMVVTIQPHYYQTMWFYIVVAVALASSVFAYVRLRTGAIRKRSAELRKLVDERTREIAAQRDELATLNEELNTSQEEVLAQRDALVEKNNEVEKMNFNLEKMVAERTTTLEERNKQLAEYAFINAHQLRAPLASILGIIHLLRIETDEASQKKLFELLQASSDELDSVIRSMRKILEEGDIPPGPTKL
jgi:ligand-binding sensor domain-containing protein